MNEPMGQLADALKKLQEDPSDLSNLPNIIAKVEETESSVEGLHDRIGKLQDTANKYLAQIPIPGQEPNDPEPRKAVSFDEAKDSLLNAVKGVNE